MKSLDGPDNHGLRSIIGRADTVLRYGFLCCRSVEAWCLWFEYFGGTIRQIVVDFILHPAIPLSWDQKRYFLEPGRTFGEVLRDRIRIVYPLHGVAQCTAVE